MVADCQRSSVRTFQVFSEGGKEAEEGNRAGRESQDAAPAVAIPFGSREIVRRGAVAHPLLLSCFMVLSPVVALAAGAGGELASLPALFRA